MDTGISSPGTMEDDLFSGHCYQPVFYFALDSHVVLLALPAAVSGAIKGDQQSDIPHGFGWTAAGRVADSSGKEGDGC
jgi:hypothetical protein